MPPAMPVHKTDTEWGRGLGLRKGESIEIGGGRRNRGAQTLPHPDSRPTGAPQLLGYDTKRLHVLHWIMLPSGCPCLS
jgi:hypothetical protein